MIKYLQRRYALSRKGAVDNIKGMFCCALQNISFMLPVGLLYLLVGEIMNGTLTAERIPFYVIGCIAAALLIVVCTRLEYDNTYPCHLCGVRRAPGGACGEAAEDSAVVLWKERSCRPDLLHHERLRRAGAEPVPLCRAAVRRDALHHGHRRVAAVFQLAHGAGRHLAAACGVCHRRAGLRRAEKAFPQSDGGEDRLRGRHSGVHRSHARPARQQRRRALSCRAGKENPRCGEPPHQERAGNGRLRGVRRACSAAGHCHDRPCGRIAAGQGRVGCSDLLHVPAGGVPPV